MKSPIIIIINIISFYGLVFLLTEGLDKLLGDWNWPFWIGLPTILILMIVLCFVNVDLWGMKRK